MHEFSQYLDYGIYAFLDAAVISMLHTDRPATASFLYSGKHFNAAVRFLGDILDKFFNWWTQVW